MILVLITSLQSKLNDSLFDDTLVEKLTSDNFEEYIEKSPLIVLFYAHWSQQSKDFVDDYIHIASELEESIFFGAIDCDENEEICHSYEVRDFPSIIIFKDKQHRFYSGEKNVDAIFREVTGKIYSGADYDEEYGSPENINEHEDTIKDNVDIIRKEDDEDDINERYDTTENNRERFNDNPEDTTNSSHVFTSSSFIIFLTIIANIIC